MVQVFISYRRDDVAPIARRIHHRLLAHFEPFHDDEINLGEDFAERLDTASSNSKVLLAIIGPRWLELLRSDRYSASDWVRREIETGLSNDDCKVIPVFIDTGSLRATTDEDISKFPFLAELKKLISCWAEKTPRAKETPKQPRRTRGRPNR